MQKQDLRTVHQQLHIMIMETDALDTHTAFRYLEDVNNKTPTTIL